MRAHLSVPYFRSLHYQDAADAKERERTAHERARLATLVRFGGQGSGGRSPGCQSRNGGQGEADRIGHAPADLESARSSRVLQAARSGRVQALGRLVVGRDSG